MSYCQLLLPFPVDQFWLYISGMAHSIIILNYCENFGHVSVSWLVMAGAERATSTHTHTHTHTLRYETISTRKFFSLKYVTEKRQLMRSCSVGDEWMSVKPWWNDTVGWKLKYLEENLSQCYFDCHKFDWVAWHWTSMVRGRWLAGIDGVVEK